MDIPLGTQIPWLGPLGPCISWAGAHHCSGPGSLAVFLCLCPPLECHRGLRVEVEGGDSHRGTSALINSYFPGDPGPLFQGLPARRQAAWAQFPVSTPGLQAFLGNMGSLFPHPTTTILANSAQ